MKRPQPMNRLLQGDVGSGKTIVALMAALVAMENGFQVAFMAPTEILAEQHFINIRRLLEALALPAGAADRRARRRSGAASCRRSSPAARCTWWSARTRCVEEAGRLSRARPRDHRRAASLRRAAARHAAREGPAPGRARHDRHADSAHARADDVRRSRRVGHARDAAGPAADQDDRASRNRGATRSTSSSAQQIDDGPAGLRHLSAGRGVGEGRSRRPRPRWPTISRRTSSPRTGSRCCTGG